MVTNTLSEQPRTFRPKREPACHSDRPNPPPPHPITQPEGKKGRKEKRKGKRHSKGKHKQKSFPLAFRPTANPKAFVSSA